MAVLPYVSAMCLVISFFSGDHQYLLIDVLQSNRKIHKAPE